MRRSISSRGGRTSRGMPPPPPLGFMGTGWIVPRPPEGGVGGRSLEERRKPGEGHRRRGGGGAEGAVGMAGAGGGGAPREVRTPLLEMERYMQRRGAHPVGTVTFFCCEGGGAAREAAVEELRGRLVAVVRANPWLLGRVEGFDLVFEEPGAAPDGWPPDFFRVYAPEELRLQRTMSLEDLTAAAATTFVGRGAQTPFVRLSVIWETGGPDGGFAVVFSMDHVVGDGHTYYALLAMLGGTARCRPLNPIRKPDVEAQINKLLDKETGNGYGSLAMTLSLMGAAAGDAFARVRDLALGRKRDHRRSRIFSISKDWVRREKAAASGQGGVDFVSTNDLVTSWWFRSPIKGTRKPLMSCMAVNFRNRAEGCNEDDAGNYEGILNYLMGDVETPARIRKSLQGGIYHRAGSLRVPLPTTWESIRSPGYSICTNWSSFDRGMALPGCSTDLHFPLFGNAGLPSNWRLCVVFRPRAGEVAVYLSGHPHLLPPLDDPAGPLTEPADITQASSRRWF